MKFPYCYSPLFSPLRAKLHLAFVVGLGAVCTLGLAAGSARAQSAGVKTDLGVYQQPAPAPLPRAGGKWVDPTFGSELMRVTDEITTGGANAGTAYSYWPTFNSDNTRLLVMQDGSSSGFIYEFDPVTFTLGSRHEIPAIPGGNGHVLRGEDAIWSSRNPAILYAHSDAGAKLWAYNVNTRAFTQVADLSSRLMDGGRAISQMSKSDDDDIFAATVRAGDPSWAFLGYIVYQASTDTVLRQGTSIIDECQIDKSGRYLYIQTALQGPGQIYGRVLDVATGAITDLLDPAPDHAPGHADSGAGAVIGGSHYLNAFTRRDLATPHSFTTVFDFKDSWNNPNHISMLAADEGWMLASFYGSAEGGVYAGLFKNEIVQIRTDGSQQVRRLVHHQSVLRGYYDSPRANISRDGRFVAFTSNWGGSARRDLFVAKITPPGAADAAPAVSITTPTNAATLTAGAYVSISAAASSGGSPISRVDFYADGQFVGATSVAPYNVLWAGAGVGSHALTAKATDSRGVSTMSSPVTVNVAVPVNSLPSVSITSPAANAELSEGANISISAVAADGDGTIARVDFYVGTQFIGATATSPYVVLWNRVPAGNYTLTAIATDNAGGKTTSAPVGVKVSQSRGAKFTGSKGGGKKTNGALTQSSSPASPDVSPSAFTGPVAGANPPGGARARAGRRRWPRMSRLIQ